MKKNVFLILIVFMCFFFLAITAEADDDEKLDTSDAESNIEAESNDDITDNIGNMAGITYSNKSIVNEMIAEKKFTAAAGHAFAAERGNNLIDRIKGFDANVIGDDNAPNGADRLIVKKGESNVYIQDKYYKSARESINACFENDKFRYYDPDGNPMKIEVPKGQGEEAIKILEEYIREGKVDKVTNPEQAKNIIREGHLTHDQAKNLARAGTVESLTYDAVNGIVSTSSALGISTVINFAMYKMNGCDSKTALEESAKEGIKSGAVAFGTTVLAEQIVKTGITKSFEAPFEKVSKKLGEDFAKSLLKVYGKDASGTTAVQNAAKILENQAILSVVTTTVLTVPDAIDIFNKKISAKQFMKNVAETSAGVAGGVIGGTIGGTLGGAASTAIAPGAGTSLGTAVGEVVGGGVGSIVGSMSMEAFLNVFVEDDAEEMVRIIQDEYIKLLDEYIVDESTAEIITDEINRKFNADVLKEMYSREDKNKYARNQMLVIFEDNAMRYDQYVLPTEDEMRYELLDELEGTIYIH